MEQKELIGMVSILVLGISAYWIAWRLRLPSILLLIIVGFIAGPLTGWLEPDAIMGPLLVPVISLAVAVILFEGGLNLKFKELGQIGAVVRNLVTLGMLITWAIATFAAYLLFDFSIGLALILGAILVVTGPTVTLPLLRLLRPSHQINSIIKWEGIVIDPLGAILAVLVFEAITAASISTATAGIVLSIIREIIVAGLTALAGATILVQALKRFWVPEYLHNAFVLMIVLGVYSVCEYVQESSGLLAAMTMGIILANQKSVDIRHIAEFKENLRILIISSLFITLSARLDVGELYKIAVPSLILLAVLVLVGRPLSVLASTIHSTLKWKERTFLAALAPRGIVAAAMASVFAIRLGQTGYAGIDDLVPVTFVVIAGSVAFYGLGAPFFARWLGVAVPDPQGIIIVGGGEWVREIGGVLHDEGFQVTIVDDTWANISGARMRGLQVFYADMLSERTHDELDWTGIGYLLTATSDDEYNSLVVAQFGNIPGRHHVFQLAPTEGRLGRRNITRGRIAFTSEATYDFFDQAYREGASIKISKLSQEYSYETYLKSKVQSITPLFIIDEKGKLTFFSADKELKPQPGQRVVSMIAEGSAGLNCPKTQPDGQDKDNLMEKS